MKGSVALDGISLTVAGLQRDKFTVSVIPHTASETTLLDKTVGDRINIECDIIGKYIRRFLNENSNGITMDFLMENGF